MLNKVEMAMYADDSTICSAALSNQELDDALHTDLRTVASRWGRKKKNSTDIVDIWTPKYS